MLFLWTTVKRLSSSAASGARSADPTRLFARTGAAVSVFAARSVEVAFSWARVFGPRGARSMASLLSRMMMSSSTAVSAPVFASGRLPLTCITRQPSPVLVWRTPGALGSIGNASTTAGVRSFVMVAPVSTTTFGGRAGATTALSPGSTTGAFPSAADCASVLPSPSPAGESAAQPTRVGAATTARRIERERERWMFMTQVS